MWYSRRVFRRSIIVICVIRFPGDAAGVSDENYGRCVGSFQGFAHGVRGTVYAVDENTMYVRGFCYDGIGPSKCAFRKLRNV